MLYIIMAYGLVIGSFLNVCIYRIPRDSSVSDGRSKCTSCGQVLRWYDLMPVISFILLKGKCRFCSSKISSRYLFVEILNMLLYILLYYKYGFSAQYVLYALFASALIVIAMIDYEHKIIPNKVLVFVFVLALLSFFLSKEISFFDRLIGFFAVSLPLLVILILSKGGIGGGDIKMMAVCGLIIGWKNILLSLFIGSIFGAVYGVVLIITGRKNRKDIVPLGPFLAIGIYISIILGSKIIEAYLRLL